MITLFGLDEAKAHLRVTAGHSDADIELKIQQATSILLDYLKVPQDATVDDSPLELPWSTDLPPWNVHAAGMLILWNLHYERDKDPLTPAVMHLLHRLRDPAMA